jgi:16S rRNA processing protein RimM
LNNKADQPSVTEDLVIVALITKPHGLKGALKVKLESDNPDRFAPGSQLLLVQKEGTRPMTVESFTPQNRYGLLKLAGIDTVEQAGGLRDAELAVRQSELASLGTGEYYTFQILGLKVISTEGEELGKVVRIEEYPAGDIYLVDGPQGKFYIPARGEIIVSIDLKKGAIIINDLEGLR